VVEGGGLGRATCANELIGSAKTASAKKQPELIRITRL
jgi:hypothetical protein